MGIGRAAAGLLLALAVGAAPAIASDAAEEAVFALRAAYSEGDEVDQIEALDRGALLGSVDVVDEIARGLDSTSPAVREAALRALGRNPSPRAGKALQGAWRSEGPVRGNAEHAVLLARGLGRHGDPASTALLADRPFRDLPGADARARILALSRVRTRESLETLLENQRLCTEGSRHRRRAAGMRFPTEFRAALAVLTGVDRGSFSKAWQSWWKEKGEGFAVPAARPSVPEGAMLLWEAYWGEAYTADRPAPDPLPAGAPFVRVSAPRPEEVKEAVAGIRAALADEDDAGAAAGFEEFAGVDDPAVLEEIAAGLGSPRRAVRGACVSVLGWIGSPAALDALHRFYRSTAAAAARDEDLLLLVLKAIGRHGSPASIHELADAPFLGMTWASGRARILGLGNIRRKESVEALMAALALGGTRTKLSWKPESSRFLRPLRLALLVLTCQDFGADDAAWKAWWKENEATFEVPKRRPELPPELKREWEAYWGVPYR